MFWFLLHITLVIIIITTNSWGEPSNRMGKLYSLVTAVVSLELIYWLGHPLSQYYLLCAQHNFVVVDILFRSRHKSLLLELHNTRFSGSKHPKIISLKLGKVFTSNWTVHQCYAHLERLLIQILVKTNRFGGDVNKTTARKHCVFIRADILVTSLRKLCIFVIQSYIYRIKVCNKHVI